MNTEADYKYDPDYAVPPGETLLETIESLGMTQRELALRTGRPVKTINEIIKGKTAITPDTAIQFERVLGAPASFWNSFQRNYDEARARLAERRELERSLDSLKTSTIREVIKKGWVNKRADKIQQLREVLTFLGVASPGQWDEYLNRMRASFRKSSAFRSDPEALVFWLRKGEIEARNIECAPYNATVFRNALARIRNITQEPPEVFQPQVQQLCAEAGVAVVFVPELNKTRVSGASRWVSSSKATVQLSLRYKSDDQLWFSFFHEAAHVLLHGKRPVYVDLFLETTSKSPGEEERQANEFSANTLIPPRDFEHFVGTTPYFSKTAIRTFAERISIAPGIVVGRLQHEGRLPHSHCNDLKKSLVWAS